MTESTTKSSDAAPVTCPTCKADIASRAAHFAKTLAAKIKQLETKRCALAGQVRTMELEEALRDLVSSVDDDFMSNSGRCGWHDDDTEHNETICPACIARKILGG